MKYTAEVLLMNYFDKFPRCAYVFNVTHNENIIFSECPYGMKGLKNAGARPDLKHDLCSDCPSFKERLTRIFSVEEAGKEKYKEGQLKNMILNKKLKDKNVNRSYLYNDIMIHDEDRDFFDAQCRGTISQESRKRNIEEARKVKATDIF